MRWSHWAWSFPNVVFELSKHQLVQAQRQDGADQAMISRCANAGKGRCGDYLHYGGCMEQGAICSFAQKVEFDNVDIYLLTSAQSLGGRPRAMQCTNRSVEI